MRNSLDVVAQGVGEIVHRINAPLIAGLMMLGVANAIEHRVAQPHVGRAHIDFRPKCAGPVREFARFHAGQQIETLLRNAVPEGTLLAEAAIFVCLLRRHVADIGLAFAHERGRKFVELIEIVRRVTGRPSHMFVGPSSDEPFHIEHDGIDVLGLLLGRVGVVHANVAYPAEFPGDAEVKADRFRVADVKIPVGLRRKTRANLLVLPGPKIFRDDIADEIRGSCGCFLVRRSHRRARQ